MKITPAAGPQQPTADTGASSRNSSAMAARERAIAKLTQAPQQEAAPVQQAQQHPVQNPTNVAAEEMSAIVQNQGQSSVNEAVAVPPQPNTPEANKSTEPALSSQYAVLARKEKQLRDKFAAERQKLDSDKAELDRLKAEYAAKDQDYQQNYIPKSRLTEDTINTLLDAGITYDQITQLALQQGNVQQDPVLQRQLAELKAQNKAIQDAMEESRKQAQEAQKTQYQEAVKQITFEAQSLVRGNPEFEAIDQTGSVKDVVELIEKTFKEDGVLLTVEEAAKEVEDHLVEQLGSYATKIKKLQQKFQTQTSQASPKSPVQNSNQPTQTQQASSKTLTNSMSTGSTLTARQRAILAFEGKLKQ